MGEYEAEIAQKTGDINIGLLRLHNVYGPGSIYYGDEAQVIPSLIRKAVMFPNEPFVVWGSGKQYRDFIYIDDVVDALVLLAKRGMNQGLIQIGVEKAIRIEDLAKLVVQTSGKSIEIIFDRTKPEGDIGRIAVCDRARSILNWEMKVKIEQGIIHTYKWIKNKIDEIENQ